MDFYKSFHDIIVKRTEVLKQLNVENGKLGFCIYFYIIAKLKKDTKSKQYANKLFKQICLELSQFSKINAVSDLAQMGIAIDFLIKEKYINGNSNAYLTDFDDFIFMKMTTGGFYSLKSVEIISILYYLYLRIEEQKKGSDERYMLEELCIQIFNNLYETINSDYFEEPLIFSLQYKLPLFIFIISKLYSLDFYNYRLTEVIKEISNLIISKLPILHSNRLFLLWSLIQIKEVTNLEIWNEQILILTNNINGEKFFLKNLKTKIYL